jgi:hypothetical protein
VYFNQICLGPACVDSKANQVWSVEIAEPSIVAGSGEAAGTTFRVAGSKVIVVDEPFFTNSK